MKKILSLVLVAMMLMAAMTGALSAATITVNDPNGILADHTFVAYQILAGDFDKSSGTLSNVSWGNGVDAEDLVAELKKDDYDSVFSNGFDGLDVALVNSASGLAEILKNYAETSVQIETFIAIALKHLAGTGTAIDVANGTDLADGYYLIVDTTKVDGEDEVANAALLQVAGESIEINAKVEKPPHYKKVKENADFTADDGFGVGYNDVATYSIGDTIPFNLYSVVPDLTQYEYYEMSFHDNMSKGFTLDPDSFVVTIGGIPLEKGTTSGGVHTGDYHVAVTYVDVSNETAATPAGNTLFTVHIPDLKTIQLKLDGGTTRPVAKGDEIVVSYTAVLDEDANIGLPGNINESYLEYTNNPDIGGNGKTPEDKVIVFTLGLVIDKVDGANHETKLKGVEFVVWKDSAKTAFAVTDANGKFAGWELVSALTDANSDGLVNPYDYSSATKKAVFVTDINGNVLISGLDNGTYYIEETKELAGYNAIIGLIELTIDATTVNGQTWDFTPNKALTALDGDTNGNWHVNKLVENRGGTVLPETGGMGTVLFVTVGCLLILGAAVVMVTRKKMSVYED